MKFLYEKIAVFLLKHKIVQISILSGLKKNIMFGVSDGERWEHHTQHHRFLLSLSLCVPDSGRALLGTPRRRLCDPGPHGSHRGRRKGLS